MIAPEHHVLLDGFPKNHRIVAICGGFALLAVPADSLLESLTTLLDFIPKIRIIKGEEIRVSERYVLPDETIKTHRIIAICGGFALLVVPADSLPFKPKSEAKKPPQ